MGIESPASPEPERQMLRHTLATLAYRGGKTLRGAPEGFSAYGASETTRTPGQVLAHIGDLLDWALSISQGKQEWHNSEPQSWETDSQRFFAGLAAFDAYLASGEPLGAPAEKLFQGPIADALTHVLSFKDGHLTTPGGTSYRVLALDPHSQKMSLPVLRKR